MRFFLLFISTILLFSCSVNNTGISKRKYRKGFHINLAHKVDNSFNEIRYKTTRINIDTNKAAQSEKEKAPISERIITLNGDTILAKIISLRENEIKYKKSNNPDGPDYYINPNKIKKIIDGDGNNLYEDFISSESKEETNTAKKASPTWETESYYEPNQNSEPQKESEKAPKTEATGVISYVFGLVEFGFLLVGGILTASGIYVLLTAAGEMGLVWGILALYFAFLSIVQFFVAGIIAFITGLISETKAKKKNKKNDWRQKVGFGLGILAVVAALAGIGLLFLSVLLL